MGRARAWLRLALMQKKIADYLQALVEHKEDLAEYYEPQALMMSDEVKITIKYVRLPTMPLYRIEDYGLDKLTTFYRLYRLMVILFSLL